MDVYGCYGNNNNTNLLSFNFWLILLFLNLYFRKMSSEMQQLIVQHLNDPPFSMKMTLLQLDAIPNSQLLQTLSDVIW